LDAGSINVSTEGLFIDVTVKLKLTPAAYNGVFARRATINPGKGPTESDISLSTLENAQPWDGYENDILPPKNQGRYQIFSLYRRLFGVVFVRLVSQLRSLWAEEAAFSAE